MIRSARGDFLYFKKSVSGIVLFAFIFSLIPAQPAHALRNPQTESAPAVGRALNEDMALIRTAAAVGNNLDALIEDLNSNVIGVRERAISSLAEFGKNEDKRVTASVFITGNSITIGIIDSDGRLAHQPRSIPLEDETGNREITKDLDKLLKALADEISYMLSETNMPIDMVKAISIATTGDIEPGSGIIKESYYIPCFTGINLKEKSEAVFQNKFKKHIQTVVNNDAVSVAVAEGKWGIAEGKDSYIYIHAGTGIGGSQVLRGQARNLEPEKNIFPDPLRPDVSLSELGSGDALKRRAQEELTKLLEEDGEGGLAQKTSLLKFVETNGNEISAKDKIKMVKPETIAKAVEEGDRLATTLMDEAGGYIGRAIVKLAETTGERFFIIGGGLSRNGECFYDALRRGIIRANPDSSIDTSAIQLAAPTLEQGGLAGASIFVPTKLQELAERMKKVVLTGNSRSAEAVIEVLETVFSPENIQNLARLGHDEAAGLKCRIASFLIDIARDKNNRPQHIRRKAIEALGIFADERAIEPLLEICAEKTRQDTIRAAAVDAVSRIVSLFYTPDEMVSVGMDGGGTKTATAVVTGEGNIEGAISEVSTGAAESADNILNRFTDQILTVLARQSVPIENLRAVSIIIPGILDTEIGLIKQINAIQSLNGVNLVNEVRRRIKERTGVDIIVLMHNDAQGAAMAEKVFGAGWERGLYSFLFITVSTGVGGALVRGDSIESVEPGSTIIQHPGRYKYKDKYRLTDAAFGIALAHRLRIEIKGALKKVSSPAELPEKYQRYLNASSGITIEQKIDNITPAILVDLANAGNEDAKQRIEKGTRVSDAASGTAMAVRVKEEIKEYRRNNPNSKLPDKFLDILRFSKGMEENEKVENISAVAISSSANEGNLYAQAIIEKAAEYIGRALVILSKKHDENAFVFGGGITTGIGDFFITPVKKALSAQVHNTRVFDSQTGGLVVSNFGNERGILGAYAYAPSKMEMSFLPVVKAVSDSSPRVKEAALEVLCRTLKPGLERELNQRQRMQIEKIKEQVMFEARGLLKDKEPGVRIEAAELIGLLGDEEDVAVLISALADASGKRASQAVEDALRKICSRADDDDKVVVGVDVGLSDIVTGAFNAKNELITETHQIPTRPDEEPELIMERIAEQALACFKSTGLPIERLRAISIGCSGEIDEGGNVIISRFLPKLEGKNLKQEIAIIVMTQTGRKIEVQVKNDIFCAVRGESEFGAGKQAGRCAFIVIGKETRGFQASQDANEVDIVGFGSKSTYSGTKAWRSLANRVSGFAIARDARNMMRAWLRENAGSQNNNYPEIIKAVASQYPGDSVEAMVKKITARDVSTAAEKGDSMAMEIIDRTADFLASSIFQLAEENRQEKFVILGGVAQPGGIFISSVKRALRSKGRTASGLRPMIEEPLLGKTAGIRGAALLIPNKKGRILSSLQSAQTKSSIIAELSGQLSGAQAAGETRITDIDGLHEIIKSHLRANPCKKLVVFLDMHRVVTTDLKSEINERTASAIKDALESKNIYIVILTLTNQGNVEKFLLTPLRDKFGIDTDNPRFTCLPNNGIELLKERIPTEGHLNKLAGEIRGLLTSKNITIDEEITLEAGETYNYDEGKNYLITVKGAKVTVALYRTVFVEHADPRLNLVNALKDIGIGAIIAGRASIDAVPVKKYDSAERFIDNLRASLSLDKKDIGIMAIDDEYMPGYAGRTLLEFALSNNGLAIAPALTEMNTAVDKDAAPSGCALVTSDGPSTTTTVLPAAVKAMAQTAYLGLYNSDPRAIETGRRHVERVTDTAILLAKAGQNRAGLHLTDEQIDTLRDAALLHDIARNVENRAVRDANREFAEKYNIPIFSGTQSVFLNRVRTNEGVRRFLQEKFHTENPEEIDITDAYIAVAIREIEERFNGLASAEAKDIFKEDAHRGGIDVNETADGAIFSFSGALYANTEAYLNHEKAGADQLRKDVYGLGPKVSENEALCSIVEYHAAPQRMPLSKDLWVKLAAEYLYTADNFESRCNQAKQRRPEEENLWHEVILYDALPILKRRMDRNIIRPELYKLTKDLAEAKQQVLIETARQAMQVQGLPDEEFDRHLSLLKEIRKKTIDKTALVAADKEILTQPAVRTLTAMGYSTILVASTQDEINRLFATYQIDLLVDLSQNIKIIFPQLPPASKKITNVSMSRLRKEIAEWL